MSSIKQPEIDQHCIDVHQHTRTAPLFGEARPDGMIASCESQSEAPARTGY
jgi:hypothetical protein